MAVRALVAALLTTLSNHTLEGRGWLVGVLVSVGGRVGSRTAAVGYAERGHLRTSATRVAIHHLTHHAEIVFAQQELQVVEVCG